MQHFSLDSASMGTSNLFPVVDETIDLGRLPQTAKEAIEAGNMAGLQQMLKQMQHAPNGGLQVRALGEALSKTFSAEINGVERPDGTLVLNFKSEFLDTFFSPFFL